MIYLNIMTWNNYNIFYYAAEESIKRYELIESESGIKFFDPVGFLSVWKKEDLSPEYFDEINSRAEETKASFVTDEYLKTHFPYLRYGIIQ